MVAPIQDTQARPAGFGRLLLAPHGRIEDRCNNFTAIRLGFALLIVYGHALMLPVGLPVTGAWASAVDGTVQYALDGFFILSGYMLTASLMRGGGLADFAAARIVRIFPGLAVAVLACWLFIGPLSTTLALPDYFSRADTWLFPVAVIGQIAPQAGLPGVFEDHPLAFMDGPLWTIRYELACYLVAGLMAAAGLWRRAPAILAMAAAAAAWSVSESIAPYEGPLDDTLFAIARFGGAFMVGAAFFAARDRIPLAPLPAFALAAFAACLSGTPLAMISGQIAVAYVSLLIGFIRLPGRAGGAVREVEDVSFGVYILHWPVGQLVLNAWPHLPAHVLFAAMLASAVALGWLMRVSVERPALALRPALARLVRSGAARLRRRPAAA